MFEQRHFYAFIMRLTVEERVFILESYLKTTSYVHCRLSFFFFEKFGRQAPVESEKVTVIIYSVLTGQIFVLERCGYWDPKRGIMTERKMS